jgi:cephalosporin hydroxylase
VPGLRSLFARSADLPVDHQNPADGRTGEEFEVDAWALSDFVVHRLVPVVGTHPFPLHELMLMSAVMCHVKPPLLFEWGTHVGKSARVFHECAAHYRLGTEIHSTDLPDDAEHVEHPRQDRGRLVRGLAAVHLHQGDGLATSLSVWRASGSPPGPLFFVDGDHAYDSVLRELVGIAEVAPDASLLVHDTFFQSADSGYNIGPYRAVAELLERFPGRYRRCDSGLGLPGMTFLWSAGPGGRDERRW